LRQLAGGLPGTALALLLTLGLADAFASLAHLSGLVNTLVLAYVGASLPILVIFGLGNTSFTGAVNSESIAEPIVATLVGSIGLIAAVPLTTALAALLALNLPERQLRDAGHSTSPAGARAGINSRPISRHLW
jgi:uncharacterized membrane protein